MYDHSRGGNEGFHWGVCLTKVCWGLWDHAALTTKNKWMIWRSCFFSVVFCPDLPSSSSLTLPLSSHFLVAQWWANGSLWATPSPAIPSFSLKINVLSLSFVQLVLLNQPFRVLSLVTWQRKEALDMQILNMQSNQKIVEHWMTSVSWWWSVSWCFSFF